MNDCPTCKLIITGGMFVNAECKDHPKKEPFFKGYKSKTFFNFDNETKSTKLK